MGQGQSQRKTLADVPSCPKPDGFMSFSGLKSTDCENLAKSCILSKTFGSDTLSAVSTNSGKCVLIGQNYKSIDAALKPQEQMAAYANNLKDLSVVETDNPVGIECRLVGQNQAQCSQNGLNSIYHPDVLLAMMGTPPPQA